VSRQKEKFSLLQHRASTLTKGVHKYSMFAVLFSSNTASTAYIPGKPSETIRRRQKDLKVVVNAKTMSSNNIPGFEHRTSANLAQWARRRPLRPSCCSEL